MIEKVFDVPFIADLALREKQIQQNYRPLIAVHKWFARRPGTLFRGLMLSEFSRNPLRESFYQASDFHGLHVCDPFMGGGTPLLEANRLGCDVTGFDINPMSYWIVKQEMEYLDLDAYTLAANSLRDSLEQRMGHLYRTTCSHCGAEDANVKYFLWVKVATCSKCDSEIVLFPGYLLAADSRHPKNVFVCPSCGQLTESGDRKTPGPCDHCGSSLTPGDTAKRNRCRCGRCGTVQAFPNPRLGPLPHRLFAIEYQCFRCRKSHKGRYFKAPDSKDLLRVREVDEIWAKMAPQYVPDDEIPTGDETNRLHRWGYKRYREMFNARQLLGLEWSAQLIAQVPSRTERHALATNFSDLLRYQNMLCRYDAVALKSLDIFSVHGFPVGLIQCESNLLGIMDPQKNVCIGSGGWSNIIEKYRKAKAYCQNPFEVKHNGGAKKIVPIVGEWIGHQPLEGSPARARIVDIRCEDAAQVELPPDSLDGVFTDPPYFGNVQYAELMDFCYVWLRRLLGRSTGAFEKPTTRHPQELTGNEDMGRGLSHFTEGLSAVFQRMAQGLKMGAPLAFTYHHNDLRAYYPLAVAILDSGLTCSATLPCPAEMGASIHINGTKSSIIDTVFVCRSTGTVLRRWLAESPQEVARLVAEDLASLRCGNVKPTLGDARCIAHGHLLRLAIWSLRNAWNRESAVSARIERVAVWLLDFGEWAEIQRYLREYELMQLDEPLLEVRETSDNFGAVHAEVSF